MDENYYKQYEPIFGAWKIKKKLGEGNFGAVYEIEREDFGTTYRAALKTITIPKTQAELESILDDGMDATSAESYLEQFVEKIVSEFVLMSKLKGNSYIVSYEDHQVIKHKDGIGWDILIRMELLTPMMSYMKTNSITKRDVIKLGIDMCRALELCQKYNIIHRDIKPENIFISDSGDFKLGDFGIAKEVEKTQSGLTKTGTQSYMAPEVYKGQPYGSSVDMYSLGVVLYRLLNHNRAPFMPQFPEPISYSDRERALIMRMGGHPFPWPTGVEEGCRLAEIAMRACSFNPDDRYSSPTQMREDLEAILYSEGEGVLMFPGGDAIDIKSVHYVSNSKNPNRTEHLRDEQTEVMGIDDDATEVMDDARSILQKSSKKASKVKSAKKKKNPLKLIVPLVAVAAIAVGGYFIATNTTKPAGTSEEVATESEIKNPVEITLEAPAVTENDYEIIKKRLDVCEMEYVINEDDSTITVSKDDLGKTSSEVTATINMIFGRGEIEITNSLRNTQNSLANDDFKNATFKYREGADSVSSDAEDTSILTLFTTLDSKDKLTSLTEEITESENNTIYILVDSKIRYSNTVTSVNENGEITVLYNDDAKLTLNQMKLVDSYINDGVLRNAYDIYIDEDHEIDLYEEEMASQKNDKKEDKPLKSGTSSSGTKQPSVNHGNSGNNSGTQQPSGQQSPQQPQQTTPPASSNPAGMPEVYIDFD